jgi:Ca2+/Na+ antiporter
VEACESFFLEITKLTGVLRYTWCVLFVFILFKRGEEEEECVQRDTYTRVRSHSHTDKEHQLNDVNARTCAPLLESGLFLGREFAPGGLLP